MSTDGYVHAVPSLTENRSTTPTNSRFTSQIVEGWAEPAAAFHSASGEQAPFAALRRQKVSAAYQGVRLIVSAGVRKRRSNDMDYPFRAHSDFAWLTGWGSESEPGATLVFEPTKGGHEITLFFRPSAGRGTSEFYSHAEIGEFWIGPRPSLEAVGRLLAIEVRDIGELAEYLTRTDAETVQTVFGGARDSGVDAIRVQSALASDGLADLQLSRSLAELRLVKDTYEVEQLQQAVEATGRGFTDVLAELPQIAGHARGERLIESAMYRRARLEGNAVGYNPIVAAGEHSCVLHWMRNDGPVRSGDLVLIDAGVEADSLYTADITRVFPINGRFSDAQRKVYDTLVEASDAALATVRPGARFRDAHDTAMRVIADRLSEWGLIDVSGEESMRAENQDHRRYIVHGISHHLGLDVHDCALARTELYLDGVLEEGMVFTIEPGLYFRSEDLTVPDEFKGIGIRIEDDIVVTATGARRLSDSIPRTSHEVEAWMREAATRKPAKAH